MTQSIVVTIDNIQVTGDGDPSGEGEIYWYFSANSVTIDDRPVSQALKTASGENIPIHASRTVVVGPNDALVVYFSVSDKDSGADGADESASDAQSFSLAQNWGAGLIRQSLTRKNLSVTVFGRIDVLPA